MKRPFLRDEKGKHNFKADQLIFHRRFVDWQSLYREKAESADSAFVCVSTSLISMA